MGQLAGKRILTFGDSIIAGHLYEKAGFVEFAAEQEGMKVVRFARNGACILPGRPVDEEGIGGMILTDQIARAAKEGCDPKKLAGCEVGIYRGAQAGISG